MQPSNNGLVQDFDIYIAKAFEIPQSTGTFVQFCGTFHVNALGISESCTKP